MNRTRLVVVLILGLLTLLLLVRLGDIDVSLSTLRRVQPGYLLAAIAVHYSGFVVRGDRWRRLLGAMGHAVSFGYAFSLLLAGWFVSALVPARAGDLARAGLLRRDHDIPVATGLGSVAAERAFDALALVILVALAGTWALAGRVPQWVWRTVAATTGLFVLACVGLILFPRAQDRLTRLSGWPFYHKALGFVFALQVQGPLDAVAGDRVRPVYLDGVQDAMEGIEHPLAVAMRFLVDSRHGPASPEDGVRYPPRLPRARLQRSLAGR